MDSGKKEKVIQQLRQNGCRITKQRRIILDIILEDECRCSKEIYYKSLHKDRTIGIATVYRMLNMLETVGAIDRKNFYRIGIAENGNTKKDVRRSFCAIEFADGSSMELPENQWDEVIKTGLARCGYSQGKELKCVRMC